MARRGPVVLATGGTGGHVFPAEALAGELEARGVPFALVTDARGRQWQGALARQPIHYVRSASPSGSMVQRLRAVMALTFGLFEAWSALGRLAPSAVVGFGGYASVPAVAAAQRAGVPTLLHEQNAVLGRANRLLAPRARIVATSFPKTASLGKAVPRLTGNPVRPAIAALAELPYPAVDGPLQLLVLGGSQGARVFARLLPPAIEGLPPGLRGRIRIAQQCRPEDLEQVRAAYAAFALPATLADFFTDVAEHLAAAHLVISRSGASTVAELAAAGRPSILLPYPHATDDHQTANAAAFANAGGGWLVPEAEASPARLGERLAGLLAHPGALSLAAAAARNFGRRDAARRLADLAEELAPANGTRATREAA